MDTDIEETQRFTLAAFRASAAVFYWINDDLAMHDEVLTGLPEDHILRYHAGMADLDPLSVKRLVSAGSTIGVLSRDRNGTTDAQFSVYADYLHDSAVTDVMDLIFYHDGLPFAGLGIHKTRADPPFCPEALRLAQTMQPYIEFNLRTHSRIRPRYLRHVLMNRCRLTQREIEVAELVRQGCTNHDIADELNIALGTVKTHLFRAFEKLGVENRAALVARLNLMENDRRTREPSSALST